MTIVVALRIMKKTKNNINKNKRKTQNKQIQNATNPKTRRAVTTEDHS